jgi:hypothetical protein
MAAYIRIRRSISSFVLPHPACNRIADSPHITVLLSWLFRPFHAYPSFARACSLSCRRIDLNIDQNTRHKMTKNCEVPYQLTADMRIRILPWHRLQHSISLLAQILLDRRMRVILSRTRALLRDQWLLRLGLGSRLEVACSG